MNSENTMSTQIADFLKEHGIKPSYPRVMIYEYLVKYKNHPTADMVYNHLVNVIPTLSKTTVYNTLNLFVEKKVAIILEMTGGEARYDADVSLHGHLKCEKCNDIYDLKVSISDLMLAHLDNFQINEIQVSCKGICPNCRV